MLSQYFIRIKNNNQVSFSPFGLQEVSILFKLTTGHLSYCSTDVPPQSNSPTDYIFHSDQPQAILMRGLLQSTFDLSLTLLVRNRFPTYIQPQMKSISHLNVTLLLKSFHEWKLSNSLSRFTSNMCISMHILVIFLSNKQNSLNFHVLCIIS